MPTSFTLFTLPVAGVDLLAQYADIELAYGLTEEQLEERVQEADALIVMNATQVGFWMGVTRQLRRGCSQAIGMGGRVLRG